MAATVFAAFWPALHNDFVKWDDDLNFLLNPHYRGLGWTQLCWMFTTFHLGPYQPLSWLTLGLDYRIWGMDPFGYHLTNNLLHALNAALLYTCAVRLLRAASPSTNPKTDHIPLAAAFTALAYALHPLRVESVAWITERRDVLSGFFFLLTINFYLAYAAAPELRRRSLLWAVVSYAAACLSKGIVVTMPLVLALLDVYPLRRLPPPPTRWFDAPLRPLWREKIPFWGMALLFGIVGIIGQTRFAELRPLETYGWTARLAQSAFSVIFYCGKTLLPTRLLPLYPLPKNVDLLTVKYLASAAILLLLTALFVRARRLWPAGLAAWSYFLITLLPVLGILQFGRQIAADRYTYLPAMGWAMALGGLLLAARRVNAAFSTFTTTLVAAYLSLLFMGTRAQCRVWRDTETLWRHTLAKDDANVVAHNNLGLELSDHGKPEEAAVHFLRALELTPDDAQIHNNLAQAWKRIGRLNEAVREYEAALRLQPRYPLAYDGLGLALALLGRWDEAIESYRRALEISPHDVLALASWADALCDQKRFAEALPYYRRALALDPDHRVANHNLGIALIQLGQKEAGIAALQNALRIDPNYAAAHLNLAAILLQDNRVDEAASHYAEALKLLPENSAARIDLRDRTSKENLRKIAAGIARGPGP